MRHAFALKGGKAISVIIEQEETGPPPAFTLGIHVVVTSDVDLHPHGMVYKNERGTVVRVDEQTGVVEILLEVMHRGLAEWHNCMWLIPFYTDDILGKVGIL